MNLFPPSGIGRAGIPYEGSWASSDPNHPSSRFVNVDGTLAQRSDGSFKSMNDTMQRALILLALGVKRPDKIGADFVHTVTTDVRTTLKPLVDEGSLEIVSVDVDDSGRSTTFITMRLKDLLSGEESDFSV